jgi:hypothetical protein
MVVMVLMRVLGVGPAVASSMRPRGVGAPGGRWTVSAGTTLGVAC